jgi:hypothetical protein
MAWRTAKPTTTAATAASAYSTGLREETLGAASQYGHAASQSADSARPVTACARFREWP